MGKLDHEPEINHFSHPHPLHLSSSPPHQSPPCSACELPLPTTTGVFIYSCTTCNFSLHISCTKFPQLITHQSHPNHPLSLLPTSTYPEGSFKCDACKCPGNGLSYHCSQCSFDLHIICASKPLSVTNSLHPHPLILTFSSPYEKKGFSCDICRKIGTQQWFYRCAPCEYDIHLECANSQPAVMPPPPPLQQQHSLPVASHNHNKKLYGNQSQLMHSLSTGGGGGLQNNYPPAAAVDMVLGGNGSANIGSPLQNNYPPAIGAGPIYDGGSANTGNVMNTAEAPSPLHHHHSLPVASQKQNQILYGNQNHLTHSASTSGRLQNNYPLQWQQGVGPTYTGGNANTMMYSVTPPPPVDHHQSLPAAMQNGSQILYASQTHLMHSASTGGRLQNNYPPAAAATRVAPPPPLQHHHSLPAISQNQNQIMYGNQTQLMHSASTGGRLQNYYPPAAAAAGVESRFIGTGGNYLGNATGIVEGAVQQLGLKFVQGAVQQLGESFMESVLEGGGGDVVATVLEGVLDTLG